MKITRALFISSESGGCAKPTQSLFRQLPFTNDDIRKDKLFVSQVADHAGLAGIYISEYRVYCQYTHGALSAAVEDLDEATDSLDTPYVAYVELKVLRLFVEHCGTVCTDLDALEKSLCTHFDSGAVENN